MLGDKRREHHVERTATHRQALIEIGLHEARARNLPRRDPQHAAGEVETDGARPRPCERGEMPTGAAAGVERPLASARSHRVHRDTAVERDERIRRGVVEVDAQRS